MQRSLIPFAVVSALAVAFAVTSVTPEPVDAASGALPSGKIAFLRSTGSPPFESHIYVMNQDGSEQRQLTSGSQFDFQTDWSPDGGRIVFTRGRDLFVINAAGGGERRLTNSPLEEGEPAWSPRGRRIAFVRNGDIHLMNPDGNLRRRLTRLGSAHEPSWSPDGQAIAFALWKRPGGIWVVNADGRNLRRLPSRLPGVGLWSPAWSPDGRRIAFVTGLGSLSGAILLMNADGTGWRRLTRQARTQSGFAWSPDGRRILYDRARRGGVYSIDVDGTGQRRLTPASADGFAWSPDGRTIAYASDITGRGDIYLMNADGRRQRRLTATPEIDRVPIWFPTRGGQ